MLNTPQKEWRICYCHIYLHLYTNAVWSVQLVLENVSNVRCLWLMSVCECISEVWKVSVRIACGWRAFSIPARMKPYFHSALHKTCCTILNLSMLLLNQKRLESYRVFTIWKYIFCVHMHLDLFMNFKSNFNVWFAVYDWWLLISSNQF